MHNCKTTRERLTELLLDGVDPRGVLATDLRECTECREECSELTETLRFTTRLIETATPRDSYWPGYHARLKERLRAAQQPRVELGQYHSDTRSLLTRFFFSSVRVPVPVGLAAVIVFAVVVFVLMRVPAAEVSVVHVPVEVPVPVVQEKTVERIVYRDRRSQRSKPARISSPVDPAVASLQGFTPTDEVKLTVIKGGSTNEK